MKRDTVSAGRGRAVVVGAGPAGLTAALELSHLGKPALVLERDAVVGGLSRTCDYKGYRFDIGGHRFFTKARRVQRIWEETLGEDFLERPRRSRIYYDGKFFDYPLKPLNALRGLGPVEAARIALSYAAANVFPHRVEENFEQWVTNRFGRRLYEIFFKTYTEKVWGIPCNEISAEWAAQRIKNLDLLSALKSALLGSRSRNGEVITTLIERFHYPRHGPGMMWETMRRRLAERGVDTLLEAEVVRVHHRDGRVRSLSYRNGGGASELAAEHVISSMPISALFERLEPAPPAEVLAVANSLAYRDFLTAVLIVDRAEVFPDNWIYIHSPDVLVGRVQNFKNWSPEMVPDPTKTSLGLEYFVDEGDALWEAPDDEVLALAAREIAALGLIRSDEVVDGTVIRVRKAYPVYNGAHREALAVMRGHLAQISGLQQVGRNGQHRYNNQDHAMLTGLLAARNVAGERHDIWSVNVEQSYHEEVADGETTGDRLTPEAAEPPSAEELLRAAFARYDEPALALAVGCVAGLGIFLATAALLLHDGAEPGPTLSLLGNYLLGYEVTWAGAFLGLAESFVGGAALGWVTARLINGLTSVFERSIRRRLQVARLDPLEGDGGEPA